ncbi:MAG: TonB-dependent siderophore receptor [Goleter apudmare HA4340-LM2]|jgi:iron complex outermembrane receptor protein|nr:TonB-dependent siderophore receptor [Goleter apudmare HA4340-LM2]
MKPKQLSPILLITGSVWLWCAISATAQEIPKKETQSQSIASLLRKSRSIRELPQISKIEIPHTSAKLLVQSPAPTNPPAQESVIQVTGVEAKPTDKGVEVILQTTGGDKLQITNRSAENNFIADIPNAQLRLPNGNAFTFSSQKPVEGITEITVTNLDANTVRVTVTGDKALPTAELFDSDEGLIFALTSAATAMQPPQQPEGEQPANQTPPEQPAAQQDKPIELVVTGEQDSYRVPNSSVGTRTDTPLRDIPQTINVVPRQVLRDRNARTVTEALETVPGVVQGNSLYANAPIPASIIRGFELAGFGGATAFRNGFRDGDFYTITPIGTVERVEVLKGPASVLFGAGEPGGIVNVVTRQPLSEPFYEVAFEAGSFGTYQPSIDLSGPLTTDGNVLYRFIAGYRGSGDFQGVGDYRLTTIAPSIAFSLGERTDLNLYYEYSGFTADPGFVTSAALPSDGRLTPRNFLTYYPDLQSASFAVHRFGYTLEHEFNDNLKLRNNVAISLNWQTEKTATGFALVDDRFLNPFGAFDATRFRNNYFGQIDLLGKFNTGSISHQILVGFDYNQFDFGTENFSDSNLPLIDIRNPVYDVPPPNYSLTNTIGADSQSFGIFLQDQITFSDNLKLLLGGRYDWITSNIATTAFPDVPTQRDSAFSPRVGLVYQPSETIALYASYTQSFSPIAFFGNLRGESFEPTRGTQYEVGVKADFLNDRLSATLAAYNLTRTNVLTPDPANPTRSIQTGEQRSQGIELDVTGEILPGWNILLGYAYTDAILTRDNTFPVGNRLPVVPDHQASLWTTYTIQEGALEGLGFGLGLFYFGTGQAGLDNSFEFGNYLRTDAALYYRTGRLNMAINFRNLFDIDVVASASSRAYVQRTEPFSVVGSIRWEF